jgi:hypothetical protein
VPNRLPTVAVLLAAALAAGGAASASSILPASSPSTASTARPAAVDGFPGASDTGVPAGTTLTPYTGPCTITVANTVIDARTIACDLDIRAAGVVISRSRVNGVVSLDTDQAAAVNWSYTLEDSEVDAGDRQIYAVGYGNMTVLRSNVHGGQASVQCGEKAVSCTVQDSWLHGQALPADAEWHLDGFKSDGGGPIVLRHNTIACDHPPSTTNDEGGCTGDIGLLPDFAAISNAQVENNYLAAGVDVFSYCAYGGDSASKPYPHADHVVFSGNVFARGSNGKCGTYGPVTDFNADGAGNQWINNTWDDGGEVPPAD